MAKEITLRDDDPDILDRACCCRCGADVRPVGRIKDDDYETVGYRVRHEDHDVSCSMREWPVYDPDAVEGETGMPNSPEEAGGLSICRSCLGHTQHIAHADHSDEIEEGFAVVEPSRDDDGEIECSRCRYRKRRERARAG